MVIANNSSVAGVEGSAQCAVRDVNARHPIVALIDHTASLGGGEIAMLQHVQTLLHGRFIPVVVLSSDGPLVERLRSAGVEVHVLPLPNSVLKTRKDSLGARSLLRLRDAAQIIAYVRKLARFLRTRGVDIVHANSLKADIIGGLAGRVAGVPVIWHVRDRIEDDYLPSVVVRVFRMLSRAIPHYVIANSRATLRTLNLPANGRSAAIYSGITLGSPRRAEARPYGDRVNVPSSAKDADRRCAGEALTIGLVGRISPWKGQHVFLQAAHEVHARFPNTRFQIVGAALFDEQEYEARVRALAAELGLTDCVEFTGFCDDVQGRIERMDMLVHASTTGEPFGKVVAEGMACGKPVVATRGGGVPEIIEDGVSGILVPMGDASAMAAAIIRLIERPEWAAEMGRRARKRVEEHFTIERTSLQVTRVYEELLARH
jgi:glycosyltransferase involved in cell wall biosynthesis